MEGCVVTCLRYPNSDPETDPERLVYGQCECCGTRLTKKASDRNRMHFDCWADHHCGPDNPWPPGHQCRTPRSDG